mmetsp:Transcript_14192/g.39029  ORF Transcript_14192/g.39029 Transcript_14192/m.39029 type:complete len:654 (-) Transcript_14192:267-2228(-)
MARSYAIDSKHSLPHTFRAVLHVSNATFTVAQKKWGRTIGTKNIIKNVSVSMYSGETLAVMGPSGAGKTTFLDLVTLEGSSGSRTGYIVLNGEPITQELFQRCCAHVPQHDSGWAFLTCRETLQFAADFYMTRGAEARKQRVEELLSTMGLESCADTKVGNEFHKGLSGGQCRRLSLAVAFVKDPLVVFLDEVTSGLDSASAANITKFLHELAASQDVIIACTIHQPSAKIFSGFDRLLLLSGGRVAYSGRVEDAIPHLASLGFEMPEHENPADFFLDSVNADFGARERVDKVLDAWEAVASKSVPMEDEVLRRNTVFGRVERKRQSRSAEIAVLFRRMVVLTVRDPMVYVSRVFFFVVACTFFSIVYIKARNRTQDQVFNRMWLILWHMAVPSCLSLVACLGCNLEFVAVRREIKAGMYHRSTYLVAQTMIQIPLMVVLSAAAIGFSGYVVMNWNPDAFFEFLLIHSLFLLSFECAAQLAAVSFNHPLLGMFQVINFWFASFLFGGFLVPEEDVPQPLRVFATLSPIKWATKGAIFAELSESTFEGAVIDPNSESGYSCPDSSNPNECYGVTGLQVLSFMKSTAWKHLTTESELGLDCAILAGIALAFKLLYFVVFALRSWGGLAVRAPDQVSNTHLAPTVDEDDEIATAAL